MPKIDNHKFINLVWRCEPDIPNISLTKKLLTMADVKLNNIEKNETGLREKTITVTEPKVCGCVCVGPDDKIDQIANDRGKTVSGEGTKPPIE